jgi:thiol-disulfide isomerase/thioredoxin
LSDEKFQNKVVIVQLFGTWCVNCLDETKFLTKWYSENHQKGVEIIGLAFEAKPGFEYASKRVGKMKEKLGVPYDLAIGGTKDKKEASKKFPMLNEITSFPTTIFIGKDGKVKKIHTGFSGPGTGKYYQEFVNSFNQTVEDLIAENVNKN